MHLFLVVSFTSNSSKSYSLHILLQRPATGHDLCPYLDHHHEMDCRIHGLDHNICLYWTVWILWVNFYTICRMNSFETFENVNILPWIFTFGKLWKSAVCLFQLLPGHCTSTINWRIPIRASTYSSLLFRWICPNLSCFWLLVCVHSVKDEKTEKTWWNRYPLLPPPPIYCGGVRILTECTKYEKYLQMATTFSKLKIWIWRYLVHRFT